MSGDSGAPATTSPTAGPPPSPKLLKSVEVDACPPKPPVQTTAIREPITVDDGYDQILIEYHETGEGQVTVSLISREDNHVVWGGQARNVNTAPDGVACGQHGSHGDPETKDVEPGEYEVRISYTGAVGILFTATERSSHSNDTMEHEH